MRTTRSAKKPIPPLDVLKERLTYDEISGLLFWKKSLRKRSNGKVAGSVTKAGYIEVGIEPYGRFLVHRIAWVFINGDQTDDFEVDHRDLDGTNNAKKNLRLATPSQQAWNRSPILPASGLRGACWDDAHSTKKWRAQIRVGKKSVFLGRFDTAEEAHAAYMAEAVKVHGRFFVP